MASLYPAGVADRYRLFAMGMAIDAFAVVSVNGLAFLGLIGADVILVDVLATLPLLRVYEWHGDEYPTEECERLYESEKRIAYTVFNGFEIAIDKSISANYEDVNIGKPFNWC